MEVKERKFRKFFINYFQLVMRDNFPTFENVETEYYMVNKIESVSDIELILERIAIDYMLTYYPECEMVCHTWATRGDNYYVFFENRKSK